MRGVLRRASRVRVAKFTDLAATQPVLLHFRGNGVRLRTRAEGTWYFWTSQPDVVVAALAARGVAVLPGRPKLPFWYGTEWD